MPETTGPQEGDALPVLDIAAGTAPGTALPPYARLAGVVAQDGRAWVRDHTFRSDHHRDTCTPLTGPAWRPAEPVALPMEDVIFVHKMAPGGVMPGPDRLGALVAGLVGGSVALAFSLVATSTFRERRRSVVTAGATT